MITIKKKFGDNNGEPFCEPERQLTTEEKATVTSNGGDELYYYFYQGDEPK
jgi:hypothetical protein